MRDAQRLLGEVPHLPREERAEIAAQLIESLKGDRDVDADAARATEIERRCAALDAVRPSPPTGTMSAGR
jgi:putative addiction module component (TIGR02574 family)